MKHRLKNCLYTRRWSPGNLYLANDDVFRIAAMQQLTLSETNIAPEKQWFEDAIFFWDGLF